MTKTKNLELEKPEEEDFYDINVQNGNMDIIDREIGDIKGKIGDVQKIQSTDGDTKENVTTFEQAGERTNIASGEKQGTIFGKIARWFADLKVVAFSGSYNDLADKPVDAEESYCGFESDDDDFFLSMEKGYTARHYIRKISSSIQNIGNQFLALNNNLTTHTHDGRYYTEAEVNNLLAGKSGTTHTHDDRYYTEAEVNNLLAGKIATTASCNKNWNWSGQSGQPTWLWGGNDASNMYVYNPSNFNVSHAESAGSAMAAAISETCRFIQNAKSNILGYGVGVQGEGSGFRPYTLSNSGAADNVMACGASASRWTQVIAVKGTINTSDRNQKKEIRPLTGQHMRFFALLEPVSFMYKDGDRTHIGFIAQDVEAAMKECGLTDLDFAGFCRDIKQKDVVVKKRRKVRYKDGEITEEEYEECEPEDVLDEEGNPEYIYSLRYSEFIAINTYMIQNTLKRIDALEERVAALEERLDSQEKLIK